MKIIIRHSSAFKPYETKLPINWKANPYQNKNWMHHFNSLRWLLVENDQELIESILRDFYKFHCLKNNNNPYYNALRGDHTAAIRLGVLVKLKDEFASKNSISGAGICNRLIKEELKNLQNEKMYRAGHNHGLMADIALLSLIKDAPEFRERVDVDKVLDRSAKTLSSMWHSSGLTKEHSVSYQEFNLPITVNYFRLISELELEVQLDLKLDDIINESKRFLGFALKENGEYFPLGESFRLPNLRILNEVYGSRDGLHSSAEKLLFPYSRQDGVYSTADFFILRRLINGKIVHFAATCCLNSGNHKKNDELSFSLCIDGVTIIDTPGWSAFASDAVNSYISSEFAHSGIFIPDISFSAIEEHTEGGCGFLPFDYSKDTCTGRHSRFNGVSVFRTFRVSSDALIVNDKLISEINLRFVTSRMILAQGVELELRSDNSAVLRKGDIRIDIEVVQEKSGFFMTCGSKVVSTDKTQVDDVVALDYIRAGAQEVDFILKWGW